MSSTYTELAGVLERARRREGRIVLLAAVALGLAGALVAALLGALALSRGWGPPGPARLVALALACLSLAGAAAWAALAALRRAGSPEATARFLGLGAGAQEAVGPGAGTWLGRRLGRWLGFRGGSDHDASPGSARASATDSARSSAPASPPAASHGPALASTLVSAVELHASREGLAAAGYSVELADAHVARAAAVAAAIDLEAALPATPARRAGLALAAAAALTLAALAAQGRPLLQGYARLAGLGPAAPVAMKEPITGDVELTFHYPAHTGRPPRTVSGTGGEISAPKGTEVKLTARADRPVDAAALVVEGVDPKDPPREVALEVKEARALSGRLTVDAPGTYRFRFRKGRLGGRVVAEGPPIAIAVEPDAFPEVRITAPAADVEVNARDRVRVEWTASDDFGLEDLSLVVKVGAGAEQRRPLRTFQGLRRESGAVELDLPALKLAEGDRLLYWLEVRDNDAVSGPKRGASATQVIRVYSEAEHRRKVLEQAQALWEQMVRLLAERLELLDGLKAWTPDRLALAQASDGRARTLHEALRTASVALRKEKGAPRTIADALGNAAAGIRTWEQALAASRGLAVRLLGTLAPGDALLVRLANDDAGMERELEKDVLYLEQLFDKERAQDLVRLAKELAARRRDLASLLEQYKAAPSDDARREIVAEIARMKQRMMEMMGRMGELAKGIQDEHMNAEAVSELARQQDAGGGLDEVEEKLRKGDVEGAMKALDAMGSKMQQMLAGLERTAGEPDAKNRELMKEMQGFRQQLEQVEREQEQVTGETEKVRQAYKQALQGKLDAMNRQAAKMERQAHEARKELEQARDGLSPRNEEDFARGKEALADLERSLKAKDFDAALESARKALPALQRMAHAQEDDAQQAERFPQSQQKGPMLLREAGSHARKAQPPLQAAKEELEALFPDPKGVLGKGDQQKLDDLARRQGEVEQKAGQLRQKLQELSEKAPVFPPQAQGQLAEAQAHMGEARQDLGQRNPQRGHGRQKQAMDAMGRFRQGLEEVAKKGGHGQGGQGFPFPLPMPGGEGQQGNEEGELSREKVEIPGAEAYRVPEEFRRDILEAMKQGAPEPYRPELQRYYEELVK